MTIITPHFFTTRAALAAATGEARAAALADMLQLAFGPERDAQADAARIHLREREGWHVLSDGEGGWRAVPCGKLRPRPAPVVPEALAGRVPNPEGAVSSPFNGR